MLKPPTEQEIFNFVATTHGADRVSIYTDQITNTWKQLGEPNPYAQGHFRAFMYVIHKLNQSNDFPAKDVSVIQSVRDSEAALFWLREIHSKIVEPLTKSPLLDEDVNAPSPYLIGKYRINSTMAVERPAPPPDIIPKLMYNWLVDYAKFHERIKDKIANPLIMDRTTAEAIYQKANEVNYFFCVVQPMSCINQRMGRFVEWVFRQAWNLPMKYYSPTSEHYRQLPQELIRFEKERLPQLLLAIKDVRG